MILPSRGPTAQAPTHQPAQRWGPHHLRLHRHLLRHPELLPERATLLLALSGGQDSMALLALLPCWLIALRLSGHPLAAELQAGGRRFITIRK